MASKDGMRNQLPQPVCRESDSSLRHIINLLNALLFILSAKLFFFHEIERRLCLEASLIFPVFVAPPSSVPMSSVYLSLYIYHSTLLLYLYFFGRLQKCGTQCRCNALYPRPCVVRMLSDARLGHGIWFGKCVNHRYYASRGFKSALH